MTRLKGHAARRVLLAHLGCDGLRRVRVGVVDALGRWLGATPLSCGSVIFPWRPAISSLLDRRARVARDFAESCRHRALATGLLSRVRVEQQPGVCPSCGQALSPEDTIVFGHGLLGHLDCRRPRVLSAEERTLLFIYCRDHQVAACIHCARRFHLRDVTSLDSLGIRSHVCPWCHTDLTDSIRAHLYGCAMLPVIVRRRA